MEDLPAELKSMVLFHVSDVHTLSSLIRASPSYHSVYVSGWEKVLSSILLKELGPEVLVDALMAQHASEVNTEGQAATKLRQFQKRYETDRNPAAVNNHAIPLQYVYSMGNLQIMIHTLAVELYRSAISSLPYSHDPELMEVGPSMTELRRDYRALYRFEIYCRLLGPHIQPSDPKPPGERIYSRKQLE